MCIRTDLLNIFLGTNPNLSELLLACCFSHATLTCVHGCMKRKRRAEQCLTSAQKKQESKTKSSTNTWLTCQSRSDFFQLLQKFSELFVCAFMHFKNGRYQPTVPYSVLSLFTFQSSRNKLVLRIYLTKSQGKSGLKKSQIWRGS